MVAPSYTEVERAIASVPGVVEAHVVMSPETGRGRLRIRLAPGEDPESVSWAVAATLRERFGIALDPEDIRARSVDAGTDAEPAEPAATQAEDEAPTGPEVEVQELHDARERLSEAAQAALARLHGTIGREGAEAPTDETRTERRHPLFDVLHDQAFADEPTDTADEPEPLVTEEPVEESADARDEVAAPSTPTEAEEPRDVIDLADVSELPDMRAIAAVGSRRRRAAIRDLVTRHTPDAVEVVASLRMGERDVEGRARGVPTRSGTLRAVAEATVQALRELTGQLLASVDEVSATPSAQPETIRVVVSVLGDVGEESLLGAAFVRGDLERAVMRATLDALNRRVEPLLLSAAG